MTSPTTSDQRNGDTPDVSPRKPATRRGHGGRFVKTTATNPEPTVPGAAGIPPLTEPIAIGDVVWTADDCHGTGSPIGAALAAEYAARASAGSAA